ncbi:MAG: glycoside hydrolase family 3 N-terminal domain-containing protein [Litorimonas sp.]
MTHLLRSGSAFTLALLLSGLALSACGDTVAEPQTTDQPTATEPAPVSENAARAQAWPAIDTPDLDPAIEARVTDIMARMSLEQKVGQVIQADTNSVTPEEVKQYRLGSVLSGGNSAPGDKPYADAATWLAAADEYYLASVDPDGVDVAIPMIWGIDAVHGHANLSGAVVFPHNIGLGAANNPDLIEEIARVTAMELSISGHDWTFAPTLAVPQDDRWGRTYEGYSELPELVKSYGGRIVYGLQGHPGEADFMGEGRVISSAKHFLGDGGTLNGIDQGDVVIDETELRELHSAGYESALAAGVQTVMASFNSWDGEKMHGSRYMLTDVLKDRMGFDGFVIGDWNGHGQIPGCTNTDCPQSLNAGLDMYMAPDSWKGLYESTLRHVQDGTIPMERLDDAVRRILRVKVQSGIMDSVRPSERPFAGREELLGSDAHRAVARQAVRESMVLLKNEGGVLPLDAGMTVLVTGDGADSIAKVSGGWTLSWQGGGYANSDFPNGQSILSAIREVVEAGGGTVVFDPDGTSGAQADAVIAVYGEEPYAEFQGDRNDVDFEPDGYDVARLDAFREQGLPVVSVFLSGRPLWTNPEMNDSDAFIAAFLPGSEGGGVADLLFRTDPSYDFTGRLSFSWPKLATQAVLNPHHPDYDPLFPVGYGLSYADDGTVGELPEESGLTVREDDGAVIMVGGVMQAPWKPFVITPNDSAIFNGASANVPGLAASRTDHRAQEDAFDLNFSAPDARLVFLTEGRNVGWAERRDDHGLRVFLKADRDAAVTVSLSCETGPDCTAPLALDVKAGDWRETVIPLSCFANTVDLSDPSLRLNVSAATPVRLGLAEIGLEPVDEALACPG